MVIKETGSVRVDLLGGTLDLRPINVILKNVVTLNLATSLKTTITIKEIEKNCVLIHSFDYKKKYEFKFSDFTEEKFSQDFFGPLKFMAIILNYFKVTEGLRITLQSDSPTGAGLGGSSAMGITFYKALCAYIKREMNPICAIDIVNTIEAKILSCGPAGYQDYYPAMFGGVLALRAKLNEIEVVQLFSSDLKEYLEKNLTLVYSGQTRFSGINNWEIYKSFFDGDKKIKNGLQEIANLSADALKAIEKKNFNDLKELIKKEGKVREGLFPKIVSPSMKLLYDDLRADLSDLGFKVCGAGGGGCFLLIHNEGERGLIEKKLKSQGMKLLNFSVDSPLD